jgi:hypothetical protein
VRRKRSEAVEGRARSSPCRFLILASVFASPNFPESFFVDFYVLTISIFQFLFFKKLFGRKRTRRAIWRTLPAHSDLRRRQRYNLHDPSSLDRRTASLKPDFDSLRRMLANADSDSTDRRHYGIDSSCMVLDTATPTQLNHTAVVGADAGTIEKTKRSPRAVLYARVSTDLQQKEGTIESQVVTLRRQIMAAGQELVREYIDDGYTGTLLTRPACSCSASILPPSVMANVQLLRTTHLPAEFRPTQSFGSY